MRRGCALVAGWLVVLASVPGLGTKPAPALADDPGIQWTSSWGREVSYVEPEPHRAFLLPQFPWTSISGDGTVMVTGIGTYRHPVFFNNITGGYLRPIASSSTTSFGPGPISRTGRYASLSATGPVPGHEVAGDVRSVYRFDLVTRVWDVVVADTDCSPRGISEDGEVTVLACGSRSSSSSEGTAHVVVYRVGVGEVFRADPGACASCNAAKGARALGEGPGQWWPPGWPSGTWWPFGP